MLSRALTLLVVLVPLLLAGTASSAHGGPRGDLIDCGDTNAPIPASPYGDGSFIARPSTAETELPAGYQPGEIVDAADPFRSPDEVSLESAYGTAPRWWVYEAGCTGRFVASAGTALANIELQVAGILPSWSHALLDTVVGDSDLFAALDEPVVAATEAVTAGVWEPWLPVALLLVAALVLWRSRQGRLGGAVTAAATALGVLVLTTFTIQYPTTIVGLVDDGVRIVTSTIATGFADNEDNGEDKSKAGSSDPTVAVDAQMDDMVRATQYKTWLNGVFGDADTAVAREYGPRVFRATHFSWAEYAAYRSDPNGVGKQILEAKQDAFKEHAEAIKQADPVAYEYFTGQHWSGRAVNALVNILVVCVTCLFLLFAGLFGLMAFVLIRLIVPIAPAAGVIFLYDRTRDLAVSWLKRVIGPLVMGPVCFLVALILLRLTSVVFDADAIPSVVKIGIIAVLAVVAFKVTGVMSMVPGYESARSRIGNGVRQALGTAMGAAAGAREGLQAAETPPGELARPRADPATSPGGVWHPGFEARAPSPPREFSPPEGFVPYRPQPRALGAGEVVAGEVVAVSAAEAAARRALPVGPSLGDRGLREEYQRLPEEKKTKWVPLVGYPTGGSSLEKARFYAEKLNDEELDLPDWQRNVVAGRWWNFAVADQYRATEVTINKYLKQVDTETGKVTMVKDTNYFLDGLGLDDETGSNKYCQVASLKPETWRRYVNEFDTKYDTGRADLLIAVTEGTRQAVERGELRAAEVGQPLQGEKVLRIPRQNEPIPDWAARYAADRDVTIEETDPHSDAGEVR